jgi:hypothetical protein
VNPDSFEISCTPSVQYAVTISTPADGLTFSNVAVNTTYVNVATATVTNSGTSVADWKIKGVALNNWQLDTAPGQDKIRLLGALKSVLADSADFNTADDVITTGESAMDTTHFSVNQNGDNVAKDATRLLSLRLDSPSDTTYDTVQKFRVEIKAYPASTF